MSCNESGLVWNRLVILWLFLLSGCSGGDNAPAVTRLRNAHLPTAQVLVGDAPSIPANALAMTVSAGPGGKPNVPFTSVTICTPGNAQQCQTIDNIIVDTGSTGLRLFASVLSPSLSLPRQTNPATDTVLAECMQFIDSSIWGSVKLADIRLAGEQANAIPIHVLADPELPAVPRDCSSTGRISETVREFGGNGILGLSVFIQDCGPLCEQVAQNGVYYHCADMNCATAAVPLAQQVQHPVAFFPINNNGVLLSMPDLPEDSAVTASGVMVFGIGTQLNNGLGTASVFALDGNGQFTTLYKGQRLTQSFIDSGSNGIFFFDPDLPACSSGFYCAGERLSLTATNVGRNGVSNNVSFTVVDARVALNTDPEHSAIETLAGPIGSTSIFDWGLPFFYGRNVYTAIEGKQTPGGVGPYFAY
jgi:hypothetical protein